MSENVETPEKQEIGICPVCGKGKIVKSTIGYSCSNFKSVEEQCNFTIFQNYFDKEITEEMALQLIENKETDTFNDFHRKDETAFTASLIIEDGKVKVNFKNTILETPCPICGGKIEKLLNGYACENYTKKDAQENRVCRVYIPQTICEMTIPQEEVETLLKGNQTQLIAGFKNKAGDPFASRLLLSQDLNVVFANNLCKCPKCGEGIIFVNKKAYNCSNWKDEKVKCNFTIWKEMGGRLISEDEAVLLCTEKETGVLAGFVVDGKPIERKLVIGEDYKVVLA